MHRIKRLFITVYLGLATFAAGWGTWRCIQLDLGGIGILATTLPVLWLSVGNLLLKHSATTSRWLPLPSALALTGFAWSHAFPIDPVSAGLQAGCVIGFAMYLFWYSRFGRTSSEAIGVGRLLPDFEAYTAEGRIVRSNELRGAPSLLVFYRGNWCPLCVTQVREVAAKYRQLQERGIRVVMVSPQSPEHVAQLAQDLEAPLEFWIDRDLAAARKLGLVDRGGVPVGMDLLGYEQDTVLPTVIMTDSQGRIFYDDQTDSYRVRPLPEDFLAAFERHGRLAT